MQNYRIIHDEEEFLKFVDWLPELGDNEVYYGSLFARKKYCPELIHSNDRTQLKRFTATSKEYLVKKIKQLEIPIGLWDLKGMAAPQESLVVYIHPVPRDMVKATMSMGKKCWDLVNNNHFNLVAEAISLVQKSKSKRHKLVTFDIDSKEVDLTKLKGVLAPNSFTIIETRGGYHLIVDSEWAYYYNERHFTPEGIITKEAGVKNWYQEIIRIFGKDVVDNTGDLMSPIVGCIQGGFVPKFITMKQFEISQLNSYISGFVDPTESGC